MALPTVHYERVPAGTDSALHRIIIPKLQTLMFSAGWTILSADLDAIGTGSAAIPAWDKTPTISGSAGKAIYLMPANGFTRQWYVELEPVWANFGVSGPGLWVRVGTGESGGSLTGAGVYQYRCSAPNTATNVEVLMSASEDGFVISWLGTSASFMHLIDVERARSMSGVVGEDLVIQGYNTATTSGNSVGLSVDTARVRASDGFEYALGRWFGLAPMATGLQGWLNSSNSVGNNMSGSSGEVSVPVGPFASPGFMAGVPRLFFYLHSINVVANSEHPVYVDGASRLYRTPANSYANNLTPLVARE